VTIEQLRELQDHTVVLLLLDGERLKAKVNFVDLECEDIIVDVLETNHPEHYKDSNACYTVKASDIASIEKVPASAGLG
jgi:small nuclear ribonucleoprotein (snRNP)-like protein